jgi:hypothetical protein
MLNYVTTVLVSNLGAGTILTSLPEESSKSAAAAHAGKFIVMNCDPNVASTKLYEVTASNALNVNTIKVGVVTKNVAVIRKPDGTVKYMPMVKWSNEIKAADIKSYNALEYAADTEDTAYINFNSLTDIVGNGNSAQAGKRIIVRLTYKDMPHRYRKWTESYEYTTQAGDTKAKIAENIANMINREWKRARVQAIVGSINTTEASNNGALVDNGTTKYFHTDANFGTANATTGTSLQIVALPYDDDDSVDSLNWANKVRFNANIYWTDPTAEGWEANNKHFPQGVAIVKVPGKQYAASAKLVRDREAWAMGYQGILNRGEGTWPIIKPNMETSLSGTYDALILEFENMYRAADDIQRKTKQVLEVYGENVSYLKAILDSFVGGEAATDVAQASAIADMNNENKSGSLANRVKALETAVAAL